MRAWTIPFILMAFSEGTKCDIETSLVQLGIHLARQFSLTSVTIWNNCSSNSDLHTEKGILLSRLFQSSGIMLNLACYKGGIIRLHSYEDRSLHLLWLKNYYSDALQIDLHHKTNLLLPKSLNKSVRGLRLDSNLYTHELDEAQLRFHIHEVYSLFQGPQMSSYLAYWDILSNKYVSVTTLGKWDRRCDLQGAVLINAALPYYPILDESLIKGYSADITNAIGTKCNFTLSSIRPVDGQWGGQLDEEGLKYNGIIGMIANGEADISTAGLGMDSKRSKACGYTRQFWQFFVTLNILDDSKGDYNVNLLVYFCPFHNNTWATIVISYMLLAFG